MTELSLPLLIGPRFGRKGCVLPLFPIVLPFSLIIIRKSNHLFVLILPLIISFLLSNILITLGQTASLLLPGARPLGLPFSQSSKPFPLGNLRLQVLTRA